MLYEGAKGVAGSLLTSGKELLSGLNAKINTLAQSLFFKGAAAYANGSRYVATNWPIVKATVAPYSTHIAVGLGALVVVKMASSFWQKPVEPTA